MRLLFFGSQNSEWMAQIFKNCIRPQDEIIFFTESANNVKFDVFMQENIKIVVYANEDLVLPLMNGKSKLLKIGKLVIMYKKIYKNLKKYKNILQKYGPFDVINVQYVSMFNVMLASALKGKDTRLVYSYWGSDLLRIGRLSLLCMRNWIKKGDWVTFDSIDLQDKFNELYGKCYKGRQECAYFGVQALDDIEAVRREFTKQQIKEELKIPQDRICIAVGYNGIKEQQHHKVFAAINKIPEEYKNKIYLLVQMTYGGTAEYHDSVIDALKILGIPYKVFLDYLSGKDVAKLRLVTDVFINAQTTDAFSGSVGENLYCGNILINAAWLNYKEFVRYNLSYVTFADFEQLVQVLKECLGGSIQIDKIGNREKIASMRLWAECAKRWHRILYEKE